MNTNYKENGNLNKLDFFFVKVPYVQTNTLVKLLLFAHEYVKLQ